MLVGVGEKLHIAESRTFEGSVRRHFVGEVVAAEGQLVRVEGVVFIQNRRTLEFERKPGTRTRIYNLGQRLVIGVLPKEFAVAEARYDTNADHRLCVMDDHGHEMDVHEFAGNL